MIADNGKESMLPVLLRVLLSEAEQVGWGLLRHVYSALKPNVLTIVFYNIEGQTNLVWNDEGQQYS